MECDHVDILALSQALDICIHIVSMEGHTQHLAHHNIPEGAEPSVHLLYQASHYNILYPRARDRVQDPGRTRQNSEKLTLDD